MAEITLEQLNEVLGKSKVSELSRDRVYLLVFDRGAISQHDSIKVLEALARMSIKSVAVFTGRDGGVSVFELDPKKPLDDHISSG